jgi:hypothetical protein
MSDASAVGTASGEQTPKPCSECGGPTVEVDVAGSAERPALIRQNTGRYFSRDSLVHIERARACVRCGYVRFFVDAEKLRRRAAPRELAEQFKEEERDSGHHGP